MKDVKAIIRKATSRDLCACAEIFRIESAKAPYNKTRSIKEALEGMKEDFKLNQIYVSIMDDRVVGFVMVKVDSGIKSKLWINEIWILKEYQGHGIGKALMVEIESIYKKKGIKSFELVADTGKGGAVGFYKKLNYKEDKSMVFMEKKIR